MCSDFEITRTGSDIPAEYDYDTFVTLPKSMSQPLVVAPLKNPIPSELETLQLQSSSLAFFLVLIGLALGVEMIGLALGLEMHTDSRKSEL